MIINIFTRRLWNSKQFHKGERRTLRTDNTEIQIRSLRGSGTRIHIRVRSQTSWFLSWKGKKLSSQFTRRHRPGGEGWWQSLPTGNNYFSHISHKERLESELTNTTGTPPFIEPNLTFLSPSLLLKQTNKKHKTKTKSPPNSVTFKLPSSFSVLWTTW